VDDGLAPAGRLDGEKAALRAEMRSVRRSIPESDRGPLALEVRARLLSLPEIRDAGTVLLFSSFGTEVPTDPIVEGLVAEPGRRLLLPFLEEDRMGAAEFRPGEPLVVTDYGPREPAGRTAIDPATIDAVIVPGLAFDREGFRLGYGGGHYDRYLPGVRPDAARIGICFHAQMVAHVPRGPADQRVHLVVTDREVFDCRLARKGVP